MEKKKLTPQLRFPEFKNAGEWKGMKISDLGETISGLTGKSKDDFGAGKPFVTYKQVFDNSLINFEQCERVQINDDENQNPLQQGDILFTASSETPDEVGFASVLTESPREKTYLNSFCFAIRPFNIEKIQPQFSRYLFHSPIYRKSVTAIAQGSTRYNLSKISFLEIKVPVPSLPEQQKIAYCLSSLDDLIESHNQKLELLQEHKKGLLQNLFPQEGETVPKVRFPEFEGDGEWVEKKLGKIAENLDSKRIPITSNQREKGEIPYYGASGIIDYVKDYIFDEDLLLISEDGANLVARVYPIAFSISGKTWVNNHAHVLKFKNWFTQVLVEMYLNSKNIEDFLTGMAQPKLNRKKLDIIPIPLPKNPKEQQKIASCLSVVDELITAQQDKIEQLQQHKKGLMQGLFPSAV